MTTWFGVTLLACFVLVAGLIGCQAELSDEEQNKINAQISQDVVDALLEHPKYLEYLENDDWVDGFVNALLEHPAYLEYLDDDEWVEDFTHALLEHPDYKTTPEEDCATVILMAVVMSDDHTLLPPESDKESLCAWYLGELE